MSREGEEWRPWLAESVATLPLEQQVAEIENRLRRRCEQLRQEGAALTPISIRVALGIDAETYARWRDGELLARDESGQRRHMSVDRAESELSRMGRSTRRGRRRRLYVEVARARSRCLQKWLAIGEETVIVDMQRKPSREGSGSAKIAETVYHYGSRAEAIGPMSLEDLLAWGEEQV